MTIVLFNSFNKLTNSTKQPIIAAGTVVTGNLKESTSILDPVVKIERLTGDAVPAVYNYAYITLFNRYYFITGWDWVNGLWEVRMKHDPLASWKTEIGNSEAYIGRCAYEYDGSVIDFMYPANTNYKVGTTPITTSYHNVTISQGCFVVGIINGEHSNLSISGGAVTYYVLTMDDCKALMAYLMSTSFLDYCGFNQIYTPTQLISQDMAKALINPLNWIVSCYWFPFSYSAFTSADPELIKVGYWDQEQGIGNAYGRLLQANSLLIHPYGQIPPHPQAATRGKFLNYSPFTEVSIELPPFGMIPIDTKFLEIGSYLYCDVYIDPITGIADCLVKIQDSASEPENVCFMTEATAQMGVPVQLAQIYTDYLNYGANLFQASNSFMGAVLGAMSGGFGGISHGVSNFTNSTMSAVQSKMPQVQTMGASGSFIYTKVNPVIITSHYEVVADDNTHVGRPLMAKRTIKNIPGFIQCYETEVNYGAMLPEKTEIENYMRSGFFYE